MALYNKMNLEQEIRKLRRNLCTNDTATIEKSEEKDMESQLIHQISSRRQVSSDTNWHILYSQLTGIVSVWVRSANLPTWKAQRDDIIDEIVQETMVRLLKRIRRGESGELSPVYAVEALSLRIAYNFFIDIMRRDRRLVPAIQQDGTEYVFAEQDEENYTEVALDNVFTAALFRMVAAEIALFSSKLRRAVLVDLASRMSFKGEATLLQQAFRDVGIDLEQYRCSGSSDSAARARQASLASIGFKKLGTVARIRKYV